MWRGHPAREIAPGILTFYRRKTCNKRKTRHKEGALNSAPLSHHPAADFLCPPKSLPRAKSRGSGRAVRCGACVCVAICTLASFPLRRAIKKARFPARLLQEFSLFSLSNSRIANQPRATGHFSKIILVNIYLTHEQQYVRLVYTPHYFCFLHNRLQKIRAPNPLDKILAVSRRFAPGDPP